MNENNALDKTKDNKEINTRQILKCVLLTITFPFGFLFYGIYQLYQFVTLQQSNSEMARKKLKHSCINILISIVSSVSIFLCANYYYYNIDTSTNPGEIRYEGYSRKEQEKMFDIVNSIIGDYLDLEMESINLTKNGQYKNANIVFKEINNIGFITYDEIKIIVDNEWKIIKEEKNQKYEISIEMEQSILDACKGILLNDLFLPETAKFANNDEWIYDISNDGKIITATTWVSALNIYGVEGRAYAIFEINTVSGAVSLIKTWE